ncbi:MAG: DNA translocase FtsK 4TM domain-containing protein [Planctomycetes bacterium]|nr:DNA translocase FtsK 4TM domain-containing protein [Planctomycetota bacterium]
MSSVQGASPRDAGADARPTIWSLLPIAASVFLLASLTAFRLRGGVAGDAGLLATPVVALYEFFGFEPAFMGCLLVLTWSSIWFLTGSIEQPANRLLQILTLSFCLAILVNLRSDGVAPPQGGVLGAFFAERLYSVFGFILSTIVVSATTIVMLFRATDSFFIRYFESAGRTRLAIPDPGVETQAVDELQSLELTSSRVVGDAPSGGVRILDPEVAVRLEPQWSREVASEVEDEEREEFARALEAEFEDETVSTDGDEIDDGDDVFDVEDPDELGVTETEFDDGITVRLEEVAADAARIESERFRDEEDGRAVGFEVPVDEAFSVVEEAALFVESDDDESEVEESDEIESDTTLVSAPEIVEPEVDEDSFEMPLFSSGFARAAMSVTDDAGDSPDEADSEEDADLVLEDAADAEDEEPVVVLIEDASELVETDVEPVEPTVELPAMPPVDRSRQSGLFGDAKADRELVDEAAELVLEHRRASASFLRRRLRISADEAVDVLGELAHLGVVECEPGDTQGRVVMDAEAWARARSAD